MDEPDSPIRPTVLECSSDGNILQRYIAALLILQRVWDDSSLAKSGLKFIRTYEFVRTSAAISLLVWVYSNISIAVPSEIRVSIQPLLYYQTHASLAVL